ncbi:hypothetical protein AB0M95_36920 [Sphaerisporangium sp. NPDC051017]|uniref:hypothetical protein n=1 Tax=Sphaerisporangium sp. NPDC051017 TaxID=3154636 RepID=UPI003419A6DB
MSPAKGTLASTNSERVLEGINSDSPETAEAMKKRVQEFLCKDNVSMMGGWV